ncbi:hypothetical protein C2G38_2280839 [Gigaspora rosea]|uniref:(d)CMP kinase n=1 Tax=Gigaspora rosea TaxID=44941 RepID=A0A397U529_9GLOM|nr:hypothetical protein C2G38_2280839 [Gigaspora rosea]
MYQFCIDLQELDNNYIYNNDYLKDAQDFNIKYKETLKTNTNYNYAKLQNINSEDKTVHLLSFAYNIKEIIHFNKEKKMNFGPFKNLTNPENNSPKQYRSKKKEFAVVGRDVTFNILPDAEIMILLSADIDIRALRRAHQLNSENINDIWLDILNRDSKSFNLIKEAKKVSKIIDTTNLTLAEVVDLVLTQVFIKHLI